MIKHNDLAICDFINVEKYIYKCNDGKGIKGSDLKTTFIAYGADTKKSKLADDTLKYMDWLKSKELNSYGYYLVVGRFVPENNVYAKFSVA